MVSRSAMYLLYHIQSCIQYKVTGLQNGNIVIDCKVIIKHTCYLNTLKSLTKNITAINKNI